MEEPAREHFSPPAGGLFDLDFVSRTSQRIIDLNDRYITAPWICAGNEPKAALLIQSGALSDDYSEFYTSENLKRLDRYLIRPSCEATLLNDWQRLCSLEVGSEWLVSTSSRLIGRRALYRVYAKMPPGIIPKPKSCYMHPAEALLWQSSIQSIRRRRMSPLCEACAVYFALILHRPLKDGNGRIAKAVFHGSLAGRLGLAAPFLPIGPALSFLSDGLTLAVSDVAMHASWNRAAEMMTKAILMSCQLARLIDRGMSGMEGQRC